MEVSISVKQRGNFSGVKTIYEFEKDLNGAQSLEEFFQMTKYALLKISADALKESQSRGFDKDPIVAVDGSTKKPAIAVHPLGKIEFFSTQIQATEIVLEVYKGIMERSKIVSGTYFENNFVFFNGEQIAKSLPELEAWSKNNPTFTNKDIIRFVNVVPYARKLERHGVTAQRSVTRSRKSTDKQKRSGERVLAPNGVYFLTSRAADRKYGKNVRVYFGFISGSQIDASILPLQSKDGRVLRTSYKPSKKRPKNSGPYLYPSIKLIIEGGKVNT